MECPGEKPFDLKQRELSAWTVRDRVERVLRPGDLQQDRGGARLSEALLQHGPEARLHDMVASAIEQQGRRERPRHIGDRRRLPIPERLLLRRAAQKRFLYPANSQRNLSR